MIIYLDENMPPHLAEGFHILRFPEGLKSGYKIENLYKKGKIKKVQPGVG